MIKGYIYLLTFNEKHVGVAVQCLKLKNMFLISEDMLNFSFLYAQVSIDKGSMNYCELLKDLLDIQTWWLSGSFYPHTINIARQIFRLISCCITHHSLGSDFDCFLKVQDCGDKKNLVISKFFYREIEMF